LIQGLHGAEQGLRNQLLASAELELQGLELARLDREKKYLLNIKLV
jgi:hypothetical protein